MNFNEPRNFAFFVYNVYIYIYYIYFPSIIYFFSHIARVSSIIFCAKQASDYDRMYYVKLGVVL